MRLETLQTFKQSDAGTKRQKDEKMKRQKDKKRKIQKDKKTKRRIDKKTKRHKHKNTKKNKKTKDRPKREFSLATSGQFRTLAMFFISVSFYFSLFGEIFPIKLQEGPIRPRP